jgi:hypothetical protein
MMNLQAEETQGCEPSVGQVVFQGSCPPEKPQVCPEVDLCFDECADCTTIQYCGGEYWACWTDGCDGHTGTEPNCVNGVFHCCPPDRPVWNENKQRCVGIEECTGDEDCPVHWMCVDNEPFPICEPDDICEPYSRRCVGAEWHEVWVQECTEDGYKWENIELCPHSCENGACVQICSPGERRCAGDEIEACTPDGYDWTSYGYCDFGCEDGVCKAECTRDEECRVKNQDCFGYCASGQCSTQENPGCLPNFRWTGYPDCECVGDECESDGDCQGDQICLGGLCNDLECKAWEEPKDHECVEKPHDEAMWILAGIILVSVLGAGGIIYRKRGGSDGKK